MIRSKVSNDNDTNANDLITTTNPQEKGSNASSKQAMRFGSLLFLALVVAAATRLLSPAESLKHKEVVLEKGFHTSHGNNSTVGTTTHLTDGTGTQSISDNPKEPRSKDEIAHHVVDTRLERLEKRKHGQQKDQNTHIQSEPSAKEDPSFSSKSLKVAYPIFVLNLPKSGTTTLWQYFECGLGPNKAIHWWTTDRGKQIGPCVEFNINRKRPPLYNCGDFDVWLDFGYATPKKCFFPAVQGLEALYKSYPTATFLWIRRDTEAWYNSARKWGPMLDKWSVACRADFFPHISPDTRIQKEDFKPFYEATTARIRQFAKDHPDMNYLEPPEKITLSSPELGAWLEETIGIEASCWGKCQPTGKTAKCESDLDGR